MCKNVSPPPSPVKSLSNGKHGDSDNFERKSVDKARSSKEPSFISKGFCLSFFVSLFYFWARWTFQDEEVSTPTVHIPLHGFQVPLLFTSAYLISLPLCKYLVDVFCIGRVDMKELLLPSMIFYNVAQVFVNCWMVYRFLRAVLVDGHPFIGDMVSTKCTFVIWVHYTNKYLEFLDTYFMVLRGKMNQVSFLHIYHHFTIAWAWWIGLSTCPFGDAYFGALLNSIIHIMMYSYYAMSLLKIPCPFKRYLTMAQLTQFATVILYSAVCVTLWPQEGKNWKAYTAIIVQVWEMMSLFGLFTLFYRKSYGKKNGKDRINKAVHNDHASTTKPKELVNGGLTDLSGNDNTQEGMSPKDIKKFR